MKTRGRYVLAAKVASALVFSAGLGMMSPASAQWAVIDAANVSQTTITALENVRHAISNVDAPVAKRRSWPRLARAA